jgi:hypothetical protein
MCVKENNKSSDITVTYMSDLSLFYGSYFLEHPIMGASSSVDSTRTQERRENTLQSRSHLSERSTDLSERDTLRQQKHEQDMQIKWPLPKIEEEKDFVPKRSRIDKSQYSFVRSRYERVSRNFH